jgi:hypothetical protein
MVTSNVSHTEAEIQRNAVLLLAFLTYWIGLDLQSLVCNNVMLHVKVTFG